MTPDNSAANTSGQAIRFCQSPAMCNRCLSMLVQPLSSKQND